MKKITILLLLVLCGQVSFSQEFITTWEITDPEDRSINISTIGEGYDYEIDWHYDGNFSADANAVNVHGDIEKNYPGTGRYTIAIRGDFPRISFLNNQRDKDKIIAVNQWGDTEWTSMAAAFFGCSNLKIPAVDAPDLSRVTDMSAMFSGNSSLNEPLDHWDVSGVTDMSAMFSQASSFNQPLNGWVVNNVTDMASMFSNAPSFNQPLNGWVVDSVTDMSVMFYNASSFNQPLNEWEVGQVTNMFRMFDRASSFNQPLYEWDVSRVTDMRSMFYEVSSFNQSLATWDVGNVSSMFQMLEQTGLSRENYEATLVAWSNLPSLQHNVRLGAHGLKYCSRTAVSARQNLIDIYSWNIEGDINSINDCMFITTWQVTEADKLIDIPVLGNIYNYEVDWDYDDDSFDIDDVRFSANQPLTHLYPDSGTYQVAIRGTFPRIHFNNEGDKDKIIAVNQWGDMPWTSMDAAFRGCSRLKVLAEDAPDLSRVTRMSNMFSGCTTLNESLNHWDVSNVTTMSYMFSGATLFNQALDEWNVERVSSMRTMFSGASSFNQSLATWNVSNVTLMRGMFSRASSFNQSLADWNVGRVDNMLDMLSDTDLSNANYESTLIGWSHLPSLQRDVSLQARGLQYCSLEAAVARQNLIRNYDWRISQDSYPGACKQRLFTTTWEVAEADESITIPTVGAGYNYTVSWGDGSAAAKGKTGNATHTYNQPGTYEISIDGDFPRIYFNNLGSKGKIVAVNQWGNIKWDSMEGAFYGCSNLAELPNDPPDLSSLTSLKNMFRGCSALNQSLNDWDVSKVKNMSRMFSGASSFNQSLADWNVSNVTTMWDMLNGTDLSNANYDATLIGWQNLQSLQRNVGLGALGLHYCSEAAASARQDLIDSDGWSILWDFRPFYCNESLFVTKWQLDKSDLEIILLTEGKGFNYTVDWGDGSPKETKQTGSAKHTYADPGIYVVSIFGDFPRIYFNDNKENKDKIIAVNQWGDIKWTSMENAFSGCSNLKLLATDAPNLSLVTSLKGMFDGCTALNQPLYHWDVRGVENMSNMLDQTGLSRENYEATLIGWNSLPYLQKKVSLGVAGLEYCSKASAYARVKLVSAYSWDIVGDKQICTTAKNTVPKPPFEEKISNNISVYPNPGNDIITINYDNNSLEGFVVEIKDMSGRVMLRKVGESSFDVSELKRGIYLIQLENAFENKVVRFIKN